jgi:hypothetical protein
MKNKMNSFFKYTLFKSSQEKSYQEKGFALPTVIGIGLFMLLTVITMIVRSNDDQVNAVFQKQTSESLASAEAGIVQLRSFLDANRGLATYDLADWKNPTTVDGVISENLSLSCDNSGQLSANQVVALVTSMTDNWQNLTNTGTPPQYKLIDYSYEPDAGIDPNNAPGTGTLVIGGKRGDSESYITIKIPVFEPEIENIPFPGMWFSGDSGAKTTKANLLGSCGAASNFELATGYEEMETPTPLPPAPPAPSTNIKTISFSNNLELPLAVDINNNDPATKNFDPVTEAYQYVINGNITGNLTFNPNYKVSLWVTGDINLQGGQARIKHRCAEATNPGDCRPTDARIIGLKNPGLLKLGGNTSICDIFFWAPTYSLDINGGGQAQGCGGGANNNGIYWLQKWGSSTQPNDGGGQGNHVSLEQSDADWDTLLGSWSDLPIQFPPKTGISNSWERVETP